MNYRYEVNATLSEESSTYVRRKADDRLYEELKAGNFCYVFNARKTGKSSLRIQVMSRLKKAGIVCSTIDMSGRNTQQTTVEKWYAGMLMDITKDFNLDINLRSWIRENDWLSPSLQFREFIETILLKQLSEHIIIFIDEIDSVLSLSFPSDDFFAFIRACHNRRVDDSQYDRLTFCLLGVATPSDLIADKQRTPFNIGRAIELTGFTLEEAKTSLLQGFVEKVDNPEAVLTEVLAWTQGQPFLTQKLCRIVVDRADSRQPNVEQLARTYLIENWQSQDEPEHLRTIRTRIISNERSAGRVLGLYQQILLQGSVATDDSPEQGTINLSGLVVKQAGKLKVYNRVYQSVFNLNWVEKELAKLRPYTEAFQAWVGSGTTDESRLLRGEALDDALAWAENKSLSDRDRLFLSNSQGLEKREIQRARELEKLEAEIDLEAERKRLAAQAQANKILKTANQKARRRLRVSIVVLVVTLAIAAFAGLWVARSVNEAQIATTVERQGIGAIQQFGTKQIQSLVLAMSAGQDLQKLVKDGRPLEKYPAASPQLALQTILDKIHEQNQLKGHTDALTSASFSPDGQRIITASRDTTARVWDTTGKPLAELKGHTDALTNANFSPDGQRIVTASDDKTARVWDTTGKQLAQLSGHTDEVSSARFSPDGRSIVTASKDKTARVWDTTGKQLAQLSGHTDDVASARFSPDGQRIVTASKDKTARVWDTAGKQLAQLNGHLNRVYSANFSPDGQSIVTASADKTARLWDTTGKQLAQLSGHLNRVYSANFSPDGQSIVTASKDKTAKVWDTKGKLLANFRGHIDGVISANFSPDGQRIITASESKTARVWDTADKQLAKLKHPDEVFSANFSADGQRIVTASADKTAQVWNTAGKPLAKLSGHLNRVYSANFSPDGQRIVTASKDATARVWNAKGKQLVQLDGHTDEVFSANFSADGQRIVTASADKTARVWDTIGKPLAQLDGHTDEVSSVNFSPDGQRIVTASKDKTARVWDTTGKLLTKLKHTGWVFDANFSPDGQRIVTASEDGTARVWDTTGKPLAELTGHTGWVFDANFSPDGQRIVTASEDGSARVWDTAGKPLAELTGHTSRVYSASFSADGQRIVTTSRDGTAQVQQFENLDRLLGRGCKWLNNYLITHPKDLEQLEVCQNKNNLLAAVPFLVTEGEERAREGGLDDATATFRQALKWDAKLNLDPEQKLQQIVEASLLVVKGNNLVREGNYKDAATQFQTALQLDSGLNTADSWNSLCWVGSLRGHATDVMYACEKALTLAPGQRRFRDSRGIARALTGNPSGAIEDFQAFVADTDDRETKAQRQRWVDALRAGQNPFTPEELRKLKDR
jgi:WD40 repeat protein